MREIPNPAVVDFPLRGEWWATSTTAERVPSHGTNFFAQRYAFDFVRMDPPGEGCERVHRLGIARARSAHRLFSVRGFRTQRRRPAPPGGGCGPHAAGRGGRWG
jgi:hypothetical protein